MTVTGSTEVVNDSNQATELNQPTELGCHVSDT